MYPKIIYNKPALDTIYFEFKKNKNHNYLKNIHQSSLSFKNKIDLINVKFKYDQTNDFVFQNLNLQINQGDTIGIIGESGKGKLRL